MQELELRSSSEDLIVFDSINNACSIELASVKALTIAIKKKFSGLQFFQNFYVLELPLGLFSFSPSFLFSLEKFLV